MDLRQYLYELWRRRILVASVTLAAVLLGIAVIWWTPPTYEASVTVARRNQGPSLGPQQAANPASSLRAALQNRRLAEAVIKEFSLDREPYRLTAAPFVADSVFLDDAGSTLTARVRLDHSPDIAAKVANRLVERAVELDRQMNQAEGAAARDSLKAQLDESRSALDSIERRIVERQRQGQLEAVQADVDAILAGRRELLTLSAEIAGEKARLAKAEEELGRRERILAAPRDVDASGALLDAVRQSRAAEASTWASRGNRVPPAPRPAGSRSSDDAVRQTPEDSTSPRRQRDVNRGDRTSGAQEPQQPISRQPDPPVTEPLNLRSQFVNPVYEALDYQVAASRSRLAALQEQERRIRSAVQVSGRNPALTRLYGHQIDLARLRTDHDLARASYEDLSRRYDGARIQAATRLIELEIVDPATPPDRPIAARPFRTLVTATSLGLFTGVLAALLIAYLVPSTAAGRSAGFRRDGAYS